MLKTRNITSFILIAILCFFVFYLRQICVYSLDIFIMTFLLIGGYEMYKAQVSASYKPLRIPLIIFGVAIYPLFFFLGEVGILITLLVAAIAALAEFTFNHKYTLKDLSATFFVLIYPMLFVAMFLAVNNYAGNLLGILLILVISLLTDTFALFGGLLFGKHKLCPEISPKKTVEGAIGGYVGALIGATALLLVFDVFRLFDKVNNIGITHLSEKLGVSIALYMVLALIIATTTVMGDLVASWIKRQAKIKDYGKIFPGHGGVMDRLDSLIFTLPAVYIFFMIFNML